MVTLLLDRDQLEVALTPLERAASFHRDSLRIARSSIVKVQLTQDPWTWLHGVRTHGTYIPGVLAAGSWKSARGTDFVLLRRKHQAVIIDLDQDPHFARLILSTSHGLALTQALRLEAQAEPTDVREMTAGDDPPQRKRPVIRPKPQTA